MLNLPLGLEALSSCSALTRRQMLQVGGLSMLGLGPARRRGRQCTGPGQPRAPVNRASRRRIPTSPASSLCWAAVPRHVDTFDLKPEAPAEIRGPYKPIATSVPGLRIRLQSERLATSCSRASPNWASISRSFTR